VKNLRQAESENLALKKRKKLEKRETKKRKNEGRKTENKFF